jgi:hypothetical protein
MAIWVQLEQGQHGAMIAPAEDVGERSCFTLRGGLRKQRGSDRILDLRDAPQIHPLCRGLACDPGQE